MKAKTTSGDTSLPVSPEDHCRFIHGAGEISIVDGWARPSRLRVTEDRLIVHPELLAVADMAAGVRMAFRTDASSIRLAVKTSMPSEFVEAISPFDVVVDGTRVARRHVEGEGFVEITDLGDELKDVVIWLPQFGLTHLGRLELGGATSVEPRTPHNLRWITYGSSITHCKEADGPCETWPSIVADTHGWDLVNLGFGGQCHLDQVVARQIRNDSADLISLCLGINVWGRSSLPQRSLEPAIIGFIDTIRDAHPQTPIVVTTPIASPERENRPNEDHLTLSEIRGIVSDVVVALQERGDRHLHLIDGLGILGPDEAFLLDDGLHPGPDGYRLMAARLGPCLASYTNAHHRTA